MASPSFADIFIVTNGTIILFMLVKIRWTIFGADSSAGIPKEQVGRPAQGSLAGISAAGGFKTMKPWWIPSNIFLDTHQYLGKHTAHIYLPSGTCS